MSDKFFPANIKTLLRLILNEEKTRNQIFGIHKDLFFIPKEYDVFETSRFKQSLETPIGVAAGPHTQLSENIISAWLCGARYIELKTIQTLDEIDVQKPCIDMQDEGYNCEWSQELKIHQAFDEYLNAWIIIHILRDKFAWKTELGTIFNMSVGYNLEGILNENVQWFFEKMENCKIEKEEKINQLKEIYPNIVNVDIPNCISDNITLSTMHGCPSDEIEKIGLYLIEEKKLNTIIKLNPTLIGAKELRDILNNKLNFTDVIPDIAFEHDLKYKDAINIIKSLRQSAKENNVDFGLKLTNTLESINNRDVFAKETADMMYMSGRALHPISVNLARKLQNEFNGELEISFSGGANCFNISDLISCGFNTITVSSDILKPGGYDRLKQYLDELQKDFIDNKAAKIEQFILRKSESDNDIDVKKAALNNLNRYADEVLNNNLYKRQYLKEPSIKTNRELSYFDCISAPCVGTCPSNQAIPEYMYYTSKGDFNKAFELILNTNPLPSVTGMVCDHLCQSKCTRINYDSPLLIKDVKRFVSENHKNFMPKIASANGIKVAIIGAGPSGLSCAYFLALSGFEVNIYEGYSKSGGMVANAIPSFRLTDEDIKKDVERIEKLGVKINYNTKIDTEKFSQLQKENNFIYLATGAQASKKLRISGIESKGVFEPLQFLFDVKNNKPVNIGKKIAIIGGGNTAMDAARTALRIAGDNAKVTIVYRRTINQMPADYYEINACLQEGIKILELTSPEEIISQKGKIKSLKCSKMKLSEKDESGRARPIKIKGSEFEIPFDTIIPSVGQDLDIDFVDNDLLEVKDFTFETKLKNVFLGGDALTGGTSIISAVADGKKVAQNIIEKSHKEYNIKPVENKKDITYDELLVKRAKREYGSKIKETALSERNNFNLITSTLTKKEAMKEASRCLFCDEICNVCVTVCPNRANYSYETKPVAYKLQKAVRKGNDIIFEDDKLFSIKQKHQILNIGDFCNECGNCTTFCPTNGAPFRDKPKFYLSQLSFNDAEYGFILKAKNHLVYKDEKGFKELIADNNSFIYKENKISAKFNKANFSLIEAALDKSINKASFDFAAQMSVLIEAAQGLYSFED
ncbi:MAG: putative selenate reductase subunit YgfK [Bacteroidetes bacterium]|nr:putative selenate reductase subunit YgfK [Bacteroidota bacterium]